MPKSPLVCAVRLVSRLFRSAVMSSGVMLDADELAVAVLPVVLSVLAPTVLLALVAVPVLPAEDAVDCRLIR